MVVIEQHQLNKTSKFISRNYYSSEFTDYTLEPVAIQKYF
jgi:hypothetical protein